MSIDRSSEEYLACIPAPLDTGAFNRYAKLPYGADVRHIQQAMQNFLDFLSYVNLPLHEQGLDRLEAMLMPANFSSLVGEFMSSTLPRYCPTLVKNRHHNGHPDLIPNGVYAHDAVLHGDQGIEIKASRYHSSWQGHNAEDVWLLVFVFDSNRPGDHVKAIMPRPFRFVTVVGAQLEMGDWREAGRAAGSRRTPTASVLKAGYDKLRSNWIYRAAR